MIQESSGRSTDESNELLEPGIERSSEEKTSKIDFITLEKINSDVVGWLVAEGTKIDYPVVRGEDNDFYLNYLFTGDRHKMGLIFMDYRFQSDFSDKNIIIYGHNMNDGSMFSSLEKYEDQRYYDSASTMLLYTPFGDFAIELFAGNIVDGTYESIQFDFKNSNDFQSHIDLLKKKSTFKSDTIVNAEDQIITLVTCSDEFNNARDALYGKLTPI